MKYVPTGSECAIAEGWDVLFMALSLFTAPSTL